VGAVMADQSDRRLQNTAALDTLNTQSGLTIGGKGRMTPGLRLLREPGNSGLLSFLS